VIPLRIQRSRARGWRMPENTTYVGRPSKWGNPFKAGEEFKTVAAGTLLCVDAAHAVRLFTPCAWARKEEIIRELRGRNLSCWCPLKYSDGSPYPCHGNVLLDMANGGEA
jgi:hypothetical protein